MTAAPHSPSPAFVRASPGQLVALHKAVSRRRIAQRLGVSLHEAVRTIARVETLTQLSTDAAGRILDELNGTNGYRRRTEPRGRRTPPGTIRPGTARQRAYILELGINQLGWTREVLAGWLRDRHEITDLDTCVVSTRTLSKIIVELEAAVMRGFRRRAGLDREGEA